MFENKLKSVSVQQVEEAIAKAVGELVGHEFTCEISNLKFSSIDGAKMIVSLGQPLPEWVGKRDEGAAAK